MKKPKLIATAVCHKDGQFHKEIKDKFYNSASRTVDGRDKLPKTKLICPTCRMWADITEIREVQP